MNWNFEFENPWFLLLLLLIPFLILWLIRQSNRTSPAVKIGSMKPFGEHKSGWSKYFPLLYILRVLVIVLMIFAFARPRISTMATNIKAEEGVDILLVVDVSLSMLAKDLEPDRLAALKKVASNFVSSRHTDRIGLVAYSGEALTKVPLTTDREILLHEIDGLKTGELIHGTALGIGLATGISHLKNSKAKSKIIILLTDGEESIDFTRDLLYVSPENAADIASSIGIKVYTIGVGTNGFTQMPYGYDQITGNYIYQTKEVSIDEDILRTIAAKTNGKYFRATDNESLQEIYNEIDSLEKSEISEIKYYNYTELYPRFLLPALLLLLLELVLARTLFKTLV